VTGPDCTVGEKVTCKLTALGRGCVIGSRSKINNCIIMEGVRIGVQVYVYCSSTSEVLQSITSAVFTHFICDLHLAFS
jgi:NDP-sugar pyrophosphorylase family protein